MEAAEQRLAATSQELSAAQSRVGQAEVAAEAKLQAGNHAAEEAAAAAAAVAARLRDVEERERAVRALQDEVAQARAELGARAAEVRHVLRTPQHYLRWGPHVNVLLHRLKALNATNARVLAAPLLYQLSFPLCHIGKLTPSGLPLYATPNSWSSSLPLFAVQSSSWQSWRQSAAHWRRARQSCPSPTRTFGSARPRSTGAKLSWQQKQTGERPLL